MSFIEKNKAWILPLLGVGLLGVLYQNFRAPAAPPASIPGPGPEAALPGDSALPPAIPEKPAGASPGDLWEDLRGFATPPSALADENAFRDQARRSAMGALRNPGTPAPLSIPQGVREPLAAPEPSSKTGVVSTNPPPGLDFLIHGPRGARVWLDGRAYRAGQAVPGQPLAVGPIGFTSVELKGPQGKMVLSTNPLNHSGPSPRPAVEAP